ncbi:putative Glycosyl transferase family 2 [Desulfosarcina cetonica]|nr:putative Glycosyl transferase family 2 [Desulfosarcina cetonica]
MHDGRVDILLATHNGAHFLDDIVVSIVAQRYPSFAILVRDDGSVDSTLNRLASLCQAFPDRIRVVERDVRSRGPVQSYARLLDQSTADYVMLCDQDDVWLESKIERSMRRMRQLEAAYGKQTPILVHSDLKVVDERLVPICDSFVASQGLNPRCVDLNRLLVKNVVTGCTMTFNRSLKIMVGEIPGEARMHDWWIALVAALFGVVDFIEQPTVLYRQHGRNHVGARPLNGKSILTWMGQWPQLADDFRKTLCQTEVLLCRYGEAMTANDRRLCQTFLSLPSETAAGRITTVLSHRFFSHGLWRTMGLMAIIATMARRFSLPRGKAGDR